MTIPQKNVALVTGAGARIGKELALALAADGWAVAVHYRVSEVVPPGRSRSILLGMAGMPLYFMET